MKNPAGSDRLACEKPWERLKPVVFRLSSFKLSVSAKALR